VDRDCAAVRESTRRWPGAGPGLASEVVSRLVPSLFLLPLAFFALFFFYPLLEIFRLSLVPEGWPDLAPWHKAFTTPYYLNILWFTIWQAVLSTLLTLALGIPGAYVFARYRFRGSSLVQALLTVPFVMPTIVVAAAFAALLGPQSQLNQWLMSLFHLEAPPLNLQYTIWIILLAHIFYNFTVVLRIVGSFWSIQDPRMAEAARTLGAGHWRAFWEVTLPLLAPAIIAAALLVFAFCFTSFGVILILGGPHFATLEVEIYRQTVYLFNLPLAAVLSIIQIIFTFATMWAYTWIQAKGAVPLNLRPGRLTQRRPQAGRDRLLVGTILGTMLLLILLPLLALAARSFSTGSGLGLTYYQELFYNRQRSVFFVPPIEAVRNSLAVATMTVCLTLALGLISAYLLARRPRRASWSTRLIGLLDPLFMLPLGTSAVTLGFGYIIALGRPPLNLRTSPALLPLAHSLIAFPFVVRSLLPVLRGINPHLREAAAVLGASPPRVWREVDLPIVGRALLVGAVFAFTVSMGEFGATALIVRPQFPTMPVAIYRFLGQPGALNYGQALAMSTLLMLVCTVGFLTIERFRYGGVGEF
jgi:thiamine transport system permease protein